MSSMRFQEVSIAAEKSGKCQHCGKQCKVRKKFYQTLNPFNKNSKGSVKSRREIMDEINNERDKWLELPVSHKKCE